MPDALPIYWHHGLYLQPQHFQLWELQARQALRPVVETALPHFWGVGALEFSAAMADGRVVDVRRARLLLPDRSYVEYPGNAALAPRRIDPATLADGASTLVYLGLRRLMPQGGNVTLCQTLDEAAAAPTRYASLARPPETPDLYSDGPAAEVATLLHVVRVFLGHELESLGAYDLIPVARLERRGGTVTPDPTFIPPSYALEASPVLLDLVGGIRDAVLRRAQRLEALKRPHGRGAAPPAPALQVLAGAAPRLVHLVQTPQLHPWVAYAALHEIAGQLSVFCADVDMLGASADAGPPLPPYDHADPRGCFEQARALIVRELDALEAEPDLVIELTRRGDLFTGALPPDAFRPGNACHLALRGTASDEAMAELAAARLAAPGEVRRLLAHALPGLGLVALAGPLPGMTRRAGERCFRIEQAGALWEAVAAEHGIALQWPGAPPEATADIVILRGG